MQVNTLITVNIYVSAVYAIACEIVFLVVAEPFIVFFSFNQLLDISFLL